MISLTPDSFGITIDEPALLRNTVLDESCATLDEAWALAQQAITEGAADVRIWTAKHVQDGPPVTGSHLLTIHAKPALENVLAT